MSSAQKSKKDSQSHCLGEERQGLSILGSCEGEKPWRCVPRVTVVASTAPGSPGTLDCAVVPLCRHTRAAQHSCCALLPKTRWMCGV